MGTLRIEFMTTLSIEGKIINHDGEAQGRVEINTETGLIEKVGLTTGTADIVLKDELIFPGFGDIHVHAREDVSGKQNYKEDFATASAAAINGGVTHFADMPNNPVAPIDDEKYIAKEKLLEKSSVHVTLYAGIGPDTSPLSRQVPYKVYMGPSIGDLFFTSRLELEHIIKKYEVQNVSFHCEDPKVLEDSKAGLTHESRRPAAAEIAATDFALYLIEKYKLIGKLCHYSTKDGLPKIIAAKKSGLPVTCEVTPHHLYFDETMLTEANHEWLRINPPIRSQADRLEMIAALKRGDIDYLATDHAPHTREEKLTGVSGVPHLDTYGPFAAWLMKEQGLTPKDIARVCAYNPGNFVNTFLPPSCGKGFGKIEEGYMGSLTILDMASPITISADKLKTKCAWSPFEGITFPGSVKYTVVAGKIYQK
jgi:dihydroorotase